MKNIHYNLIKTLHSALDDEWRIHRFYMKDAKGNCPSCLKMYEKMCVNLEKHLALMSRELEQHAKKGLK